MPTISEAADRLRTGKLSPVELTESCLRRIERLNPELNAFITVTADAARAEAMAAAILECLAGRGRRAPAAALQAYTLENVTRAYLCLLEERARPVSASA
jgi:Asp-tRNA(Asn)/Glu-tRNA(Gln) amidotransferase A subunit family amidase